MDYSKDEVEILYDNGEDVQMLELSGGDEVEILANKIVRDCPTDLDMLTIANREEACLVAQFLTASNSSIASAFVGSFKNSQATLTYTWEEVLKTYLNDSKVLEILLVQKLLSFIMPSALSEFKDLHPIPTSFCPGALVELVRREGAGMYQPHHAELALPGEKFLRFTRQEDETIMREYQKKKSWAEIGILLGRASTVVQNRFYRLSKAVTKRRFSPADDRIILDAVLGRLNGKKLVEFSMSMSEWDELGTKLNKERLGVRSRWAFTILPSILQHFNGTLNLRLDVMLVNYLISKYSSIDDISWEEVASRPEFTGHTRQSLKGRVFSNLRVNACQKYGLKTEDVSLEWISKYAIEVYGNGKEVRKDVQERQKAIIDYMEVKIAQLGLRDLV